MKNEHEPKIRTTQDVQADFNRVSGIAGEVTWQIKKMEVKQRELLGEMEALNEEMRVLLQPPSQAVCPVGPVTAAPLQPE